MKKLLAKSLLAVSLLGLVFSLTNLDEYAGIPSTHSPSHNVSYSQDAPITTLGIPSTH